MIPRYKVEKISKIWSIDNKLKTWLKVELAHLQALNANIIDKTISEKELQEIIDNVKIDKDKWKEIENETRHDVQAFVQMLEESVPNNSGRWIHYGLTSSDILDTSLTLLCQQSLNAIKYDTGNLLYYLTNLKESDLSKNKILSRTHGKVAEIQTYSDVFNRWLSQLRRAYDSLTHVQKSMCYGKLSGPSGNYTTNSRENEKNALDILNLKSTTSSQIISRDIYLDYFYSILKLVLTIEKIAYDIRIYSLDGINEMSEPFSKGQKGSSSMPHKKNPVTCENICGLSRLYKSYFQTAIDNCLTLFERDISNSAPERIIFKDSAHIACFITKKITTVISNLNINTENAENNIDSFRSLLSSQEKMNNLIKKGYSRKESHDISQKGDN